MRFIDCNMNPFTRLFSKLPYYRKLHVQFEDSTEFNKYASSKTIEVLLY